MSGIELMLAREAMGLTANWLARHLGKHPATMRKWESGMHAIPQWVSDEIRELEKATDYTVSVLRTELNKSWTPTITAYRTDEEYNSDTVTPDQMPASWQRVIVRRLKNDIPKLVIFSLAEKQTLKEIQE